MALLAQKLSLDDFLAWENQQVEKHEFHLGAVFASERAAHPWAGGVEPEPAPGRATGRLALPGIC